MMGMNGMNTNMAKQAMQRNAYVELFTASKAQLTVR
jgi:hypothetical protein